MMLKMRPTKFTTKLTLQIVDVDMVFNPYPELLFWIRVQDTGLDIRVAKLYEDIKDFHLTQFLEIHPKVKFPSMRPTRKLGKTGCIKKLFIV
eukprot:UN25682